MRAKEARTAIMHKRPPDIYPSTYKLAGKMLAAELRIAAKERAFRFTRGIVWKQEGEFIVKGFGDLYRNRFEARMHCSIKPLLADDIWWEVCGMESNKNEPLSLHATGAFVFNGTDVGLVEGKDRHWFFSGEEVFAHLASQMVTHLEESSTAFLESINWSSSRYFEFLAAGGTEPFEIFDLFYQCVGLIGLGEYQAALDLAEGPMQTNEEILKRGPRACYGTGDVAYIKKYCERKLAEQ